MALLPSLLYPGLAQADCVEELNKLKAAAATYKRITGGNAVLPNEIKELIRARYKLPYGYSSVPWDAKGCLQKTLKPPYGGWERLCVAYQRIRRTLHAWHESPHSQIQEEAYGAYQLWNDHWSKTRYSCLWNEPSEEFDKPKISALKKAGFVPSDKDL
jgi:hypothetical protein